MRAVFRSKKDDPVASLYGTFKSFSSQLERLWIPQIKVIQDFFAAGKVGTRQDAANKQRHQTQMELHFESKKQRVKQLCVFNGQEYGDCH